MRSEIPTPEWLALCKMMTRASVSPSSDIALFYNPGLPITVIEVDPISDMVRVLKEERGELWETLKTSYIKSAFNPAEDHLAEWLKKRRTR